ncbi:DNA-binding response regulator [Putridiphycobacter roseus]|uniref:DNA-binding response regulator n=1 Tax=Putridiphycobacter roseus TaxID=2219161 RepID=A0A2W1NAV5_9FLAO|nr:response regulator transcription factor [Putridiphycobacter roseus]PZE16183.1 DNA-binding response regulator [Putridiphycobacter roseus]
MNEDIKILLVEDDTNLGFVIHDYLKNAGYQVQLCINGVEGLKAFNAQTFHLCILDVMMPKKDGFTMAKDIRSLKSNVPILFLTAKAEVEDKIEGLTVGGDDYITKPFNAEEFLLRVKSLLKRSIPDFKEKEQEDFEIGTILFKSKEFLLEYKDGAKQKLTKKESRILHLLMLHKGKVLPRDIVLNAVWGQDDYFVGRSLDVFISKLRKYLKSEEKVSINNVHGVGFKLVVED